MGEAIVLMKMMAYCVMVAGLGTAASAQSFVDDWSFPAEMVSGTISGITLPCGLT